MLLNNFYKNKVPVIILLAIVVGVNFYFFGYLDHRIPVLEGDEGEYHAYASNIILNGQYSPDKTFFSAWREPGYILFIAGIYKIAGVGYFRAVHIAQIALIFISALLVYFIFVRQKQPALGLLASLTVAGNPYFAHLSSRLQTEIFFTFLLVTILYLVLSVMRQKNHAPIYFIILGLVMGWMALARLQSLYFPFVLVAMGYMWRSRFSIFTGKNSIRLLTSFFLPLIIWGLYVMSHTGKFMLQESRVDVQLYVRAERVKESWPELIKYSGLQIQNTLLGKRDPWWWQKDYRFYISGYDLKQTPVSDSVWTIIHHPAKYFLGSITEFLKLVSLYHAFNAPHFSRYIRLVWYAAMYGASFWGILQCLKKRVMPDTTLFSLLFLTYNAVMISFFNAAPIYNVPLHIFYIIIGVTGLGIYYSGKSNQKRIN